MMTGFYRSAIRILLCGQKGIRQFCAGNWSDRSAIYGYDGPSGFYSSFRGMARWLVLDLVRTVMHG